MGTRVLSFYTITFMFSLDTKEADFLCFCLFNHKIMIFLLYIDFLETVGSCASFYLATLLEYPYFFFFFFCFSRFSIERWNLLIECERARGIRTEDEKSWKKEDGFF